MVKEITLAEANELLKKGVVLKKLGPERITLRKIEKGRYLYYCFEKNQAVILDGHQTVDVLKQNTFYE
ncbi:MAG: hypothetical protein NXI00_16095 [Cytophagales bacterium]|nr:hypothetical protein [Cytophagales bacterium]